MVEIKNLNLEVRRSKLFDLSLRRLQMNILEFPSTTPQYQFDIPSIKKPFIGMITKYIRRDDDASK